ncbi:hypothetical protein [Tahibacter amnicola]|uniref:Cytochrome c-552/4 domain-containing protein n=1 Tax=Tahibacter amnicola TaxID=2976241 RepID=A0ABY6B9Q1_9GAMM|nr:hypothetical protein [Tahibacter amnicola]UXI66786.1 hypothetical protein N4264_18805 [Tahibacter amnicola]
MRLYRVMAMVMFLALCGSAHADIGAWWKVLGTTDYTPNGTQPPLTHELYGSGTCIGCHRGSQAADFSNTPGGTWPGSMMANATRDPVFWAALDVANADGAANGFPNVGEYCLRCHAPGAFLEGRVKPSTVGGRSGGNGCLLLGDHDDADFSGNDYGGTSCHFCHRLMPNGPANQPGYTNNGNAWVDDSNCNGGVDGPCRRGPYTYADGEGPPHEWAYSSYHQSSEICGICHNVSSPDSSNGPLRTLRTADGTDTGLAFPLERTYREWQQSDFSDLLFRDNFGGTPTELPQIHRAQNCQHCHMPNSTDAAARACIYDPPGTRTGNLATHQFVGGNTWVPGLLKGQYPGLNRGADFDRTIGWARALLQSSAQVDTTVTSYVAPTASIAGSLGLRVKVTNLSGHKLPTGYSEGRRMWLHVKVADTNGATVFEKGAYDPATATLTTDAQTKVYEAIHGIWDNATQTCKHSNAGGAREFHFVLDNCIAKDNRIPPLGFSGGNDLETRPVGYTYPAQGSPGRLVNYDVTEYAVALPAGAVGPFTATAELHYQTSSREYIEFLRDFSVANAIPAENTMCSTTPYTRPPINTGPQDVSRGQYLYNLWNNPSYGKSPPELIDTGTATTPTASR